MRWLGIDVGASKKGFDVAAIEDGRLIGLSGRLTCADVLASVAEFKPAITAIDSPRAYARPGERARECERQVAREICGIRWTPDASIVRCNRYYAWITEGLALYDALAQSGSELIEVFPTASWTVWLGWRGSQTRAVWTRRGLSAIGLDGVPGRTNQDQRDAIAAAATARQHTEGTTRAFGEIVVPKAASQPLQARRSIPDRGRDNATSGSA